MDVTVRWGSPKMRWLSSNVFYSHFQTPSESRQPTLTPAKGPFLLTTGVDIGWPCALMYIDFIFCILSLFPSTSFSENFALPIFFILLLMWTLLTRNQNIFFFFFKKNLNLVHFLFFDILWRSLLAFISALKTNFKYLPYVST